MAVTHRQVLLFAPNVIGYVRLALVLLVFTALREEPWAMLGLYTLQAVLDGLIGFDYYF